VKKFQTLTMAKEHEIPTRRFPIQEYIPNRVNHILNIDTCIEIICTFIEKKVSLVLDFDSLNYRLKYYSFPVL
jgi:hypothetical protein